MNFLVTGGAGFIGTNLCEYLVKEKHSVISIDNYSAGKETNHLDDVFYIKDDTKNIFKIAKNNDHFNNLDGVFHLGEYSKISTSFKDYSAVIESNMTGTSKIIDFCLSKKIKLVYAASSTKFAEEGITHSPYSFTKSQNVQLIKATSKWFDLKHAICYFYNNYGPRHDTCNNGYETVISIFEKQKLANKKLTIVKPGTQERNYTHVSDTVSGIYKSFFYRENEEFQLSADESYSLFDLAELLEQEYTLIDGRPGDRMKGVSPSLKIEIEKTKNKLNWKTNYTLKEWIKRNE
tara:strand:+ start:860 stop:1732 length:873 start_codon:yes stop_codon:yes gene_type:complete